MTAAPPQTVSGIPVRLKDRGLLATASGELWRRGRRGDKGFMDGLGFWCAIFSGHAYFRDNGVAATTNPLCPDARKEDDADAIQSGMKREELKEGICLYEGDCLEVLKTIADESVHCCVTSPPYFGLRDYGYEGQIGLEQTPEAYVAKLVEVFREVRRVLRDNGTLWLNLGDSYWGGKGQNGTSKALGNAADRGYTQPRGTPVMQMRPQDGKHKTLKPKDLIGIPWRVAFSLQADGWYLRQDIIWHKPNPMPESVRDRCTKAHEYLFLLSKSPRYYFDAAAIKEPLAAPHNLTRTSVNGQGNGELGAGKRFGSPDPAGRNKRSVWTVTPKPFKGAHFATFPPDLIEPCILAGCPVGGIVLDPFNGAGTTGKVAILNNLRYIGIELNPDYVAMTKRRLLGESGKSPTVVINNVAPTLFDGFAS